MVKSVFRRLVIMVLSVVGMSAMPSGVRVKKS
jgi:hypothetical protein